MKINLIIGFVLFFLGTTALAQDSIFAYKQAVAREIRMGEARNGILHTEANNLKSDQMHLIKKEAQMRKRHGYLNDSDVRILISQWKDLYQRIEEQEGLASDRRTWR